MTDMLVKLYDIPDATPVMVHMFAQGVSVRRPLAPEKQQVVAWVADHFGPRVASECEVSFSRQPLSAYIAVKDDALLGITCYDTTFRGVCGAVHVAERVRGYGIGRALLLNCLHSMKNEGYAYAILGDVATPEFYQKVARATLIEHSTPGAYAEVLP